MESKTRTNGEWAKLIAEQRASGETQTAWCLAKGINLRTLRNRAGRLKGLGREAEGKQGEVEPVTAGWMKVGAEREAEKSVGIRIEHGGFTVVVMAGTDTRVLTEVLRAVSRVCC